MNERYNKPARVLRVPLFPPAGKYSADKMPQGLKGRTMRKYVLGGVTERGVVYPPGGASKLIDEMRRVADACGKSVAQVRYP
jgi:hypothetical protein